MLRASRWTVDASEMPRMCGRAINTYNTRTSSASTPMATRERRDIRRRVRSMRALEVGVVVEADEPPPARLPARPRIHVEPLGHRRIHRLEDVSRVLRESEEVHHRSVDDAAVDGRHDRAA